ncbi:PA-phosphatase [Brevundimonas sp. SORGH_AS_0993]|uniref:PA-phosphatase n=1 Tax=Brevundimonas sp. SORGH_AS_0993 TaxID=3041794 RepID=UPI002787618C|nr:PA-phosphatase [Brevundimonas sp. SORGH_AS_0993]MDQ1154711.1 acid phosphatase (class A) [Brevundimonas sp. SORGH_AS_0993]
MNPSWVVVAVLAATASAGLALGGCAAGKPPAWAAPTTQGYLAEGVLARLSAAAPPPPAPGSPTDRADKAASARMVALEDTDRWLLATSHAEVRPPLGLQHFDCALGVRLGSAETPGLDRLMARVFHDAQSVAERVKAQAARNRPVGDDPDRRPCQRLDAAGRRSPSYPSGTAGATAYAEVFALLEPERAAAVRRIGAAIGDSRVICAMHYPSDVRAGEDIGRAVVADIAALPAFQADLATARAELARARATGLTNPGCAAERAALATPLP